MKKLLLVLAFVAGTFFCNAQVFVGGNIGFGMGTGKVDTKVASVSTTVENPRTTTFEINPFVGYMLNKKFGVGLDFGYGISSTKAKTEIFNATGTVKENVSVWKAAPFFRWVFGNFERVKLYADTKVSFAGANDNVTTVLNEDKTTTKGPKSFEWGIAIVPGIKFMLNDHISMNGKINLLSLGYNSSKVMSDVDSHSNEYNKTETKNTFGIGVNEKTAITLGFVYTF